MVSFVPAVVAAAGKVKLDSFLETVVVSVAAAVVSAVVSANVVAPGAVTVDESLVAVELSAGWQIARFNAMPLNEMAL